MKKIYTSNFAISGNDSRSISIARSAPPFFKGRTYFKLRPTHFMVEEYKNGRMSVEQYCDLYEDILKELDPYYVLDSLEDESILLCWEAPGKFCHRMLVANWIQSETGTIVNEISYKHIGNLLEW